MPKLHDACQIFAEEVLTSLRTVPAAHQAAALALIYHTVEEDLRLRHPDAEVISQHLWLVLNEILEGKDARATGAILQGNPLSDLVSQEPFSEKFREDDISLAMATDDALRLARRLFKTLDKPLMPL